MLGPSDEATPKGQMWPVHFAVTGLTSTDAEKVVGPLKRAMSRS